MQAGHLACLVVRDQMGLSDARSDASEMRLSMYQCAAP
jgi:hypothetical protein